MVKTPVPTHFIKPEEEASVKAIENQINNTQVKLQQAIDNKPTYAIPAIYRTNEQSGMSDEEYLQYLYNTDAQRAVERSVNEAAYRQQQAEIKAAKKAEERIARQRQRVQYRASVDGTGTAKKIGTVIYKILFWIFSIFIVLFALVSFTTNGGILSGLLFLITAILINPLVHNLARKKYLHYLCGR